MEVDQVEDKDDNLTYSGKKSKAPFLENSTHEQEETINFQNPAESDDEDWDQSLGDEVPRKQQVPEALIKVHENFLLQCRNEGQQWKNRFNETRDLSQKIDAEIAERQKEREKKERESEAEQAKRRTKQEKIEEENKRHLELMEKERLSEQHSYAAKESERAQTVEALRARISREEEESRQNLLKLEAKKQELENRQNNQLKGAIDVTTEQEKQGPEDKTHESDSTPTSVNKEPPTSQKTHPSEACVDDISKEFLIPLHDKIEKNKRYPDLLRTELETFYTMRIKRLRLRYPHYMIDSMQGSLRNTMESEFERLTGKPFVKHERSFWSRGDDSPTTGRLSKQKAEKPEQTGDKTNNDGDNAGSNGAARWWLGWVDCGLENFQDFSGMYPY